VYHREAPASRVKVEGVERKGVNLMKGPGTGATVAHQMFLFYLQVLISHVLAIF
jgi:hypothetical protein